MRIKSLPADQQLEDFDLTGLEVGRVYDLSWRLAEVLIVLGYGEPEMRRVERDRAADKT